MKVETTSIFDRQFSRLPEEHQRKFRYAVYNYLLPALDAGALSGRSPWPPRLRIHRLRDFDVYSLTWNFKRPDGRATFFVDKDEAGETVFVWRRIGDHSIYKDP